MKNFIIAAVLLLSPALAFAQVGFPFSTTYSCSAQDQSTPGWVSCGGPSSYGAWTTNLGCKEQITAAANYPGGGGGNGQRHCIGNGTNNDSGTIRFGFNSNTNEYWNRFYLRHQTGLQLGASGGSHKILFMIDCGNAQGGSCYMLFQPGTLLLNVKGVNYGNGGSWGWQSYYPNGVANATWHCHEMHFKAESSAGAGNGVVEWFVDGTQRLGRNDVPFGALGFSMFSLPSNGVFATVGGADMFEDIDDMAISKTRIGCLGATPPSPPSGPSGLTVQ